MTDEDAIRGAILGVVAAVQDAAVNPCTCSSREPYRTGSIRAHMEESSCPHHRDLARVFRYVDKIAAVVTRSMPC